MPTRPTGITILAVLAAIGGVLALLAGLFATVLGGAVGAATGSAAVGGLVSVLGLIAIVYGGLSVAFAEPDRRDRPRHRVHRHRQCPGLLADPEHRDLRGDHLLPEHAGREGRIRTALIDRR
jgi:hypothetical protein